MSSDVGPLVINLTDPHDPVSMSHPTTPCPQTSKPANEDQARPKSPFRNMFVKFVEGPSSDHPPSVHITIITRERNPSSAHSLAASGVRKPTDFLLKAT
jgi:hypothetical protein